MGKSSEKLRKTTQGVFQLAVGVLALGAGVGFLDRVSDREKIIATEQQLVAGVEAGWIACHKDGSQRLTCQGLPFPRPFDQVLNGAERQVVATAESLLHDMQLRDVTDGLLAIAFGLVGGANFSRGYEVFAGPAPGHGQQTSG